MNAPNGNVQATERRPVRVTLEGEAYRPPNAGDVLMVVLPSGHKVCLTDGPGVTVEDVTPPRVWTDGDVVVDGAEVWVRREGAWFTPGGSRVGAGDEIVNRSLVRFPHSVKVLRYQAGGDQ